VFAQVAHLKLASLPVSVAQQRLTKRQREALEWISEGKTTQDVATIMGLTTATVEKHLRKAREALQVETTAQAVMKASLQRQFLSLKPEHSRTALMLVKSSRCSHA
jgi:LuxR family transcriptional regulator